MSWDIILQIKPDTIILVGLPRNFRWCQQYEICCANCENTLSTLLLAGHGDVSVWSWENMTVILTEWHSNTRNIAIHLWDTTSRSRGPLCSPFVHIYDSAQRQGVIISTMYLTGSCKLCLGLISNTKLFILFYTEHTWKFSRISVVL